MIARTVGWLVIVFSVICIHEVCVLRDIPYDVLSLAGSDQVPTPAPYERGVECSSS